MVARQGYQRQASKARSVVGWAACLAAGLGAAAVPAAAQIRNVTDSEFKFGILKHDAKFFGGKEAGIDINPEVIFASPVADSFAAGLPWYLGWMVQPRPSLGAEINTAGFTNQFYFGATWTWQLASNVLMPGDGITAGIFFGPSFNDGETTPTRPNHKALGSNVLFREALEIGYRINPVIEISVFVDHVSNAGLARYNQSINDVGGRLGIRF
jgi:hypothetical protein